MVIKDHIDGYPLKELYGPRIAIDFNRISNRPHTPHNQLPPPFIKAQLLHDFLQTPSFYPIVRLTHIKFKHQLPYISSFLIANVMHSFKSNEYIVGD